MDKKLLVKSIYLKNHHTFLLQDKTICTAIDVTEYRRLIFMLVEASKEVFPIGLYFR